jgi:hypothetical protein
MEGHRVKPRDVTNGLEPAVIRMVLRSPDVKSWENMKAPRAKTGTADNQT